MRGCPTHVGLRRLFGIAVAFTVSGRALSPVSFASFQSGLFIGGVDPDDSVSASRCLPSRGIFGLGGFGSGRFGVCSFCRTAGVASSLLRQSFPSLFSAGRVSWLEIAAIVADSLHIHAGMLAASRRAFCCFPVSPPCLSVFTFRRLSLSFCSQLPAPCFLSPVFSPLFPLSSSLFLPSSLSPRSFFLPSFLLSFLSVLLPAPPSVVPFFTAPGKAVR